MWDWFSPRTHITTSYSNDLPTAKAAGAKGRDQQNQPPKRLQFHVFFRWAGESSQEARDILWFKFFGTQADGMIRFSVASPLFNLNSILECDYCVLDVLNLMPGSGCRLRIRDKMVSSGVRNKYQQGNPLYRSNMAHLFWVSNKIRRA